MSVLTQVLISRFNVNALGDIAVGITVCGTAVTLVPVHWTVLSALFLLAAVIGGVFLEAAVQLPLASLLLRSPAGLGIGLWVDEIMATIGNYPLSILPAMLRGVFTFVLPVAFIAYFPVLVLLGKAPADGVNSWLIYLSPAVGFLLFLISRRLWVWSLRHYQSAGG